MIPMRRGEHVRWYAMSLGTEVNLHTPHWHGNVVSVGGRLRFTRRSRASPGGSHAAGSACVC